MAVKKYSAKKNKKLSKHFNSTEFKSHVGGRLTTDTIKIDTDFIKMLEKFFDYGIETVCIISGYRNKEADIGVGGNGSGAHTKGIAADIMCYKNGKALSGESIACLAQLIGFSGIGITGSTGCHVDIRNSKNYVNSHWWGDERNGENYIKDYFAYAGKTKAELFGEIEYYKEKCYLIEATEKAPIRIEPRTGAKLKKYYPKGKRARIFATKGNFGKVLSGWVYLPKTKKVK